MDNSSDEISIESDPSKGSNPGLKYVTHWPPVNIEFEDLMYSVPDMQGECLASTTPSYASFSFKLEVHDQSHNTRDMLILPLLLLSLLGPGTANKYN